MNETYWLETNNTQWGLDKLIEQFELTELEVNELKKKGKVVIKREGYEEFEDGIEIISDTLLKKQQEKKRYALRIEYRMTCPKSFFKNICSDTSREQGFYWMDLDSKDINEQFKVLGIKDTDSIDEMQNLIEKVAIPDGCEAVKVQLTVMLGGSIGGNGTHRRNVTFEYFKDFINE